MPWSKSRTNRACPTTACSSTRRLTIEQLHRECRRPGWTARIAISDVAFKGASLDEVKAVTGHEIGHYVLRHVWRTVLVLSALAIVFFFLADRSFPYFARAFGSRATIGDPVGLPVLTFMISMYLLLAQPLVNGVIRDGENAADSTHSRP